jgi:hypothetical protein
MTMHAAGAPPAPMKEEPTDSAAVASDVTSTATMVPEPDRAVVGALGRKLLTLHALGAQQEAAVIVDAESVDATDQEAGSIKPAKPTMPRPDPVAIGALGRRLLTLHAAGTPAARTVPTPEREPNDAGTDKGGQAAARQTAEADKAVIGTLSRRLLTLHAAGAINPGPAAVEGPKALVSPLPPIPSEEDQDVPDEPSSGENVGLGHAAIVIERAAPQGAATPAHMPSGT